MTRGWVVCLPPKGREFPIGGKAGRVFERGLRSEPRFCKSTGSSAPFWGNRVSSFGSFSRILDAEQNSSADAASSQAYLGLFVDNDHDVFFAGVTHFHRTSQFAVLVIRY